MKCERARTVYAMEILEKLVSSSPRRVIHSLNHRRQCHSSLLLKISLWIVIWPTENIELFKWYCSSSISFRASLFLCSVFQQLKLVLCVSFFSKFHLLLQFALNECDPIIHRPLEQYSTLFCVQMRSNWINTNVKHWHRFVLISSIYKHWNNLCELIGSAFFGINWLKPFKTLKSTNNWIATEGKVKTLETCKLHETM